MVMREVGAARVLKEKHFEVSPVLLRRICESSYASFKDGRSAGQRVLLAVDVVGGLRQRRKQRSPIDLAQNDRFHSELAESLSYEGGEADFVGLREDIIRELVDWVDAHGEVQFPWGVLTDEGGHVIMTVR